MSKSPPGPTKLNTRLVLDLLDDQPYLKTNTLDWSPDLRRLPPAATTPMPPSASAPTPASAAVLQNSTPRSKAAVTKVFRNEKTLRQMMDEYNGRPISSTLQKKRPSVARNDFRFDSVEQIHLDEIPGKILRPESD